MRKLSEANLGMMLQEDLLTAPPLKFRVLANPCQGAGALIEVAWCEWSGRFVAKLRRDANPLTLKMAIEQVWQYADQTKNARPMIIAPYFSSKKLDQLLEAGVSAVDFSGNAAIEVPGKFFFYKTGNPNRYPDSSPIRSAYRGDGSLVARLLLLERQFQAVGDVLKAIRSRGGALTLSMVSKVLKRLEADLAIERPNRNLVRVIQPERLLDELLAAYQPPKLQRQWLGKVAFSADELIAKLQEIAGESGVVRTGVASAIEYATWASEPTMTCYCRIAPERLLEQLGAEAKETRVFANLRLIQTNDQLVYFDARPKLTASPIQAYLEMASGDKRQKEVAEQIRSVILGEKRVER